MNPIQPSLFNQPTPEIVTGDLLTQPVAVIVNAWNRNLFPWWLLVPQGVSGAIKRQGGYQPFRELRQVGVMPLGSAVLTSAGRLPYQGIIHVAGINLCWRATQASIQNSVRAAMAIVQREQFPSVAFPLIGAGTGGFEAEQVLNLMQETLAEIDYSARVILVRFTGKA